MRCEGRIPLSIARLTCDKVSRCTMCRAKLFHVKLGLGTKNQELNLLRKDSATVLRTGLRITHHTRAHSHGRREGRSPAQCI